MEKSNIISAVRGISPVLPLDFLRFAAYIISKLRETQKRGEKMDGVTMALAAYVRERGITVTTLADKTGLSYGAIYPSLCQSPTRKLRADEFMRICNFLDVDPLKFKTPTIGLRSSSQNKL